MAIPKDFKFPKGEKKVFPRLTEADCPCITYSTEYVKSIAKQLIKM